MATDIHSGNILTSTNPTGGPSAWNTVQVEPHHGFIGAISCPSVSLCVATDANGHFLTSTDPTGGANAWTVTNINGGFLTRIACQTTTLCVAGSLGNLVTSTDPTGGAGAWTSVPASPNGFTGISCPTASLCVAVGNSGQVATSSNPAAGATSWTTSLVDVPPCALTSPCIAEQLYAYDSHGTTLLDTAPPGSGTGISNLDLTDVQLTWTDDGTRRQATLS